MVSLTCSTQTRDGVTLVTVRLDGGAAAQRVRLANRLDGPVWPPRRRGVPEAGWDDGGVEAVVPADGTVALGYASPAEPADPPVELADSAVVTGGGDDERATPADALRRLGDPSPPRDAVPVPPANDPARSALSTGSGAPVRPGVPSRSEAPGRTRASERSQAPGSSARGPVERSLDSVDARLDEFERLVRTAERLGSAASLPEATEAVRAAGGLDRATALVGSLERDAETLARVADRAERLTERADAVDVPLATLERLA